MAFESDTVKPAAVASKLTSEHDAFGDDAAFRAWYERCLPRVYAYLFHRCGRDAALAEELTQQAFVEVVRTRARFRGRSDAVTWVIGIARNKLVDHYRRTTRNERRLAALGARDFADNPGPAWPEAERDEVDEALELIPPFQRAVLVLHYMDRLSVRDVSKEIGKSEAATASLLARGRDAFRQAYQQVER
jgi:RNA polymerase sigma-70 factor, ECF subfamily